ncbi:MAG: glycoside hydrolase family 2 [Dysgonamonadaceae bacterium]|nr:glycoside hydrolase family 2 [Dysgonamonadaceae bacterium]
MLLLLFVFSFNAWSSAPENSDGRLEYNAIFAPSEGFVNKYEKAHRQELCINGLWDFQGIPLPAAYKQGKGLAPELPQPTANAWDAVRIKIPSPWNINSFANRNLAGPDHRNFPSYPKSWEEVKMAWMKKTVKIPADWTDKTIKLHFEAIAGFAEVYVNNQKVAENFDIFLPFDADITKLAMPGQAIEILVGVRSQSLFENNATIGRRIIPAGSMWGSHISGIWQDVYLYAIPQIHIETIFVKPLVSKNTLALDVTIRNNTSEKAVFILQGDVKEWLNKAGKEIDSAPVPAWELGRKALDIPENKLTLEANQVITTQLIIPVKALDLEFWTPDHPNLYGIILTLKDKKTLVDTKYERFGWREWSFQGTQQCLNGKPFELRGDSWHFMGVPQLTRRYAWAWFTVIKEMNGNAVRPHAQVYPRFYLDVADELGICVMNETAIWASDGGPKMDDQQFWDNSNEHIRRFVLRDRNHASVFGWSISNENKPVILHVFNKPELMEFQKQAWKDWLQTVTTNDPTRPWVSSDGEDDGEGILPVTVGHYGDINSMKHWVAIGKPWGVGEHSMAYYGTPEQVSKYNGERAYQSQQGRMEGLANECYHLIADQRSMGASYVSVFNMVWYAIKPLPFGKKDITSKPSLTEDGIFFTGYKEGVPGIQPERIGPYSSTFNPGYDNSLPLYEPWPLFDAMKAAYAPGKPAWSPWSEVKDKKETEVEKAGKTYNSIVCIAKEDAKLKSILGRQGVKFAKGEVTSPQTTLFIVDGSELLSAENERLLTRNIAKGADVWLWGITPQTLESYNKALSLSLTLEPRAISSFLPEAKSWMKGLNNSDFYFCELQKTDAAQYGLSGNTVNEGQILLNACKTDWRKWNKQAEEIKTAAILRSENEQKNALPVFIKYRGKLSDTYVSALTEFADSEKGFNTLSRILENAGIPCEKTTVTSADIFFLRDAMLQFPISTKTRFQKNAEGALQVDCWVFSPRPLDDLLIEPDMPKLNLQIDAKESQLRVNGKLVEKFNKARKETEYKELPLQQGWNHLTLTIDEKDRSDFRGLFKCDNKKDFLPLLQITFINPEII